MAAPYTSVTVTGYNANPPPDDGTQTDSLSELQSIVTTAAAAASSDANANVDAGWRQWHRPAPAGR